MKKLLLLILLLPVALQASTEKPKGGLTMDMDPAVFYANMDNFWKSPAGKAFWDTLEGKTVLQIMFEYRTKMEGQTKP